MLMRSTDGQAAKQCVLGSHHDSLPVGSPREHRIYRSEVLPLEHQTSVCLDPDTSGCLARSTRILEHTEMEHRRATRNRVCPTVPLHPNAAEEVLRIGIHIIEPTNLMTYTHSLCLWSSVASLAVPQNMSGE